MLQLDWFDALFACQKKNLCLANLDSQMVIDQIVEKLPEKHRDEYWFGLNRYEKVDFRYVSNNEPMTNVLPNMIFFRDNADTPCAFIKPNGEKDFTIVTGKCEHRRRFICSASVKCNGLEMDNTFMPTNSTDLPCPMNSEVREILGIPK